MKRVRKFTCISENILGDAILTVIKIFQGKYALLRNAIQRHTIRNIVETTLCMFNEVLNKINVFKFSVHTLKKQYDIIIKSTHLIPFWKISLVVLSTMKVASTHLMEF